MDDAPTVREHLRPLPITDLSQTFARPMLPVRLALITILHTCCRCQDGENTLVQRSWSALARARELRHRLLPRRRPAFQTASNTVTVEESFDHRDRSAYLRARKPRTLRLDEEGRHLKSTAYRIPTKSFSKAIKRTSHLCLPLRCM